MTLEEKIGGDLIKAMKARDKAALRGIRAIKEAILNFKTSGTGETLTEEKEWQLLQKLVKQRRESLDIYEKGKREDLAQKEREEIAIIETYLPKQLGEEEIEAEVRRIAQDLGAGSMKDMGRVMGEATKALAGRADGKSISAAARKILNA